MPHGADTQFVLSKDGLPSLRDWQDAIVSWDLLVPVTLVDIDLEPGAPSTAMIAGKSATFRCHHRTVASVVRERHPELEAEWSVAYAFMGQSKMPSSVAAGVAAVSYARARRGVFYLPELGPFRDWAMMRQGLDQGLAAAANRFDLYRERYPHRPGRRSYEPFIIESDIL